MKNLGAVPAADKNGSWDLRNYPYQLQSWQHWQARMRLICAHGPSRAWRSLPRGHDPLQLRSTCLKMLPRRKLSALLTWHSTAPAPDFQKILWKISPPKTACRSSSYSAQSLHSAKRIGSRLGSATLSVWSSFFLQIESGGTQAFSKPA